MTPPEARPPAATRDGELITYLSPVRPSDFPSQWYEISHLGHFWFEWRLRSALNMMKQVGLRGDDALRVLDVGGGAGLLREALESRTRWSVDLADINIDALRAARPGRGSLLYYDLHQREARFEQGYDVALLFDVLEHVEDTRSLLSDIAYHLRVGAWLFVNVPALPSLMSAYDRAAGHLRRYRPRSLSSEFDGLPFRVLSLGYWGMTLIPLLWVRSLWLGDTPDEMTIRRGFQPPSPWVHSMLRGLMRLETASLPRTPIGTSLMLVAVRT